MRPTLRTTITSENTIFDAKASRDIYKLDGGQLALAVGYEFRRKRSTTRASPGTDTGNVIGLGYSAAFGSRNVNAIFAELYAPVLKNLELTAAIRFDDYSDVGNTMNPKIGVKWTVIPQLVLRGTYATAFRAPGLYETGNSECDRGLHRGERPGPLPDHRQRGGLPGDGARHQHRQPVHQARDVRHLDRRRDLGAGARACPARSTTGTSRPRTRSPSAACRRC